MAIDVPGEDGLLASDAPESRTASPSCEQLPPTDDGDARPCKRRRTSESTPEGYARWLRERSEDDAVAIAAQLEEQWAAAPRGGGQRDTMGVEARTQAGIEPGVSREPMPGESGGQKSLEHRGNSHDIDKGAGGMEPNASEHTTSARASEAAPSPGDPPCLQAQEIDKAGAAGGADPAREALGIDGLADIDMDDFSSVTSRLSATHHTDLRNDLAIDLENLGNFRLPPPTPGVRKEYTDPRIVTGFSRQEARDLKHTLRKWLEQDRPSRPTNVFYHRLDNVYRENKFSSSSLISRDQALIKTFLQLVEETPIEIFLATLDREGPNNAFTTPHWVIARQIVDLDGRLIARDVPVVDNLLSPEAMPHRDAYWPSGDGAYFPDFEAALVIVARDSVSELLANHIEDPKLHLPYLILYFADRCMKLATRDRLLPILKDLCNKAWDLDSTKGLCVFPQFEDLYRAILRIGDWEFFDLAASHSHGSLPAGFFTWARNEVIGGRVAFRNIEKGISSAILTYKNLRARCAAFLTFVEAPGDDETRLWAQPLLARIAGEAATKEQCGEGGELFVSAMVDWLDFERVSQLLVPVVDEIAHQTAFILGVIRGLYKNFSKLPLSSGKQLLEKLAGQAIDAVELTSLCSPVAGNQPATPANRALQKKQTVEPEQLVSFIECLVTEQVDDRLTMRLTFKIVADCDVVDPETLLSLWAPFVRLLKGTVERCNSPPLTRRFQHIYDAVVETAYFRFLGKKPQPIWEPKYRSITCKCHICTQVNAFLAGDAEQVEVPAGPTEYAHAVCFLGGFWLKAIACKLERKPEVVVFRKSITYPGGISRETWLERNAQLNKALEGFDREKLDSMQKLMEEPEVEGLPGSDNAAEQSTQTLNAVKAPTVTHQGICPQRVHASQQPGKSQVALPTPRPQLSGPPPAPSGKVMETLMSQFPTSQPGLPSASISHNVPAQALGYIPPKPFPPPVPASQSSNVASASVRKPQPATFQVCAPTPPLRRQDMLREARKLWIQDETLRRNLRKGGAKSSAASIQRSIVREWNSDISIQKEYLEVVEMIDRSRSKGGNEAVSDDAKTTIFSADRYYVYQTPAPTPLRPPAAPHWRLPPSTPSTSAPPQSYGPGFSEFVAELEPGLCKTSSHTSVESIRSVLARRRDAMSTKHRQVYADAAEMKKKAVTSTATSSTARTPARASSSCSELSRVHGIFHANSGFRYFLNQEGPAVKRFNPNMTYEEIYRKCESDWRGFPAFSKGSFEKQAARLARDPAKMELYFKRFEEACGTFVAPSHPAQAVGHSVFVKTETPAPQRSVSRSIPVAKTERTRASATQSQVKKKTPGSGRTMQSTRRGSLLCDPPSSPSSRMLASASSNPGASPAAQAASARGVKRKQPAVIDLTMDD